MPTVDTAIATLVRAQCVCLNMRKVARALTNEYDAALAPAGLRLTQFSLLAHLKAIGPTTVTDLGMAMDLDQTTVSRNVDHLHRLKLLSVQRTGRTRVLTLNTAGQAALDCAYPLWASRQSTFVAQVGGEGKWSILRENVARLIQGQS